MELVSGSHCSRIQEEKLDRSSFRASSYAQLLHLRYLHRLGAIFPFQVASSERPITDKVSIAEASSIESAAGTLLLPMNTLTRASVLCLQLNIEQPAAQRLRRDKGVSLGLDPMLLSVQVGWQQP